MSRPPVPPSPVADEADEVVLALRVPRSALVVQSPPPRLLSQLNCAHVGLDRRGYLEAVRAGERAGAFAAIRRGKLRLVDTDAMVAWLRRSSTRAPPASAVRHVAAATAPAVDDVEAQVQALLTSTKKPRRRAAG